MPRITEDIERLDAALRLRAREEAALRLRLGQALEVLGCGTFHALGFASLAAYALERCDRSVRWAEAARCLARRVEGLPELRRAMASGEVSWSMGELLARVAQSGDEAYWLEEAKSRTVRQMRVLVAAAVSRREAVGANDDSQVPGDAAARHAAAASDAAASDARASDARASDAAASEVSDAEEPCTLTCTVAQEEAWLFEATRALLGQMGVHGADAQCEALLAEAQDTLFATLPDGTVDLDAHLARLESWKTRQQLWRSELGRWRVEAEALCEAGIIGFTASPERSRDAGAAHEAWAVLAADGMASLHGAGCDELDGQVRAVAGALARHELELSRLILRFHRADGWRRLGYATETQYARERLGLSTSSLLARRSLALRLEKLTRVAAALGAGQIGVEAALQVVRVATVSTQAEWVERARQRTIKHLREEVAAALVAVRCSGEGSCPPPTDEEMERFHELEQAVVSGRAAAVVGSLGAERKGANTSTPAKIRLVEPASEQRRAWCVMLGSLADWLAGGLQTSAASTDAPVTGLQGKQPRAKQLLEKKGAGRVTLRLRMSRETYAWWRALEAQAGPWLRRGVSWLKFLCLSLWQAWRHLLGADVAYGRIYIRDRYRCMSPVCSRRDVTPHHLRFRSAGGSDDPENIGSMCTWCHLCGVHGGRIRAVGPARHIHWELGTPGSPCLIVDGRDRVRPVC